MTKPQSDPKSVDIGKCEFDPSLLPTVSDRDLIPTALELARNAMTAAAAGLALIPPGGNGLQVEISANDGQFGEEAVRGLAQKAIEKGEIQYYPSPTGCCLGGDSSMPAGSGLAFPLRAGGAALGALVIWRDNDEPPFAASDLARGKTLATEIALALDNACLRRTLSRKAHELATVQSAAARAEAHAHAIVGAAQEGIVLFDTQGVVQDFNPSAAAIFGWPRVEVVGRDLAEIAVPSRMAHVFRRHLEATLLTGREPAQGFVEVCALRRNGEEFPLEISTSVIETPRGKFLSTFCHDITARKQSEKALQESESRLQAIFNSVEAGILVIDPETHRIVDANPVALSLVGLPLERVAGAECHKFVCPADKGRCPVTDLGQIVDNSERVLLTASGEARSIIKTVRPVVISGRKLLLESFVDITARKRAEEALRDAEARFRSLFAAIPLPTFLWDLETLRYLEVNDAAVAYSGYSHDELLKMQITDLQPPEVASLLPSRVQDLRTRAGHRDRAQHRLKDGRIVDVEIDAHALDFYGRRVVLTVVQDITERSRAERALKERTAYLHTLIEISPLGIAVLDTEDRVQMSNPAFEELFLYSHEEVQGANLDDLIVPKELIPEAKDLVCKCLDGTGAHVFSRRRRKDGALVEVEIFGVPLVMDGEPRGILALYQDVTERGIAEQALRDSEARYRLLFENNLAGVFRSTREGPVLDCNSALARMLGFDSPQEILRHSAAHFYFSQDERAKFLEKVRTEGSLSNFEMRLRRKDGSPLWVIASVNPSDPAAADVIEGTFVDISKRKGAEAAMAERHRLSTLLADVGIALTGTESLQQGLQQCAEILVRDIDAAFARVWVVNEKEDVLELQASAGLYTHIDGGHARVPIGEHKIGRIAESGEPHLSNTVTEDPWLRDPDWARREGLVAFAGYPLKVGDRVLGVAAAFARRPMTEATLQAFASVSHNIAQFLERKRAEAELLKYAQDLETAKAAQEEHGEQLARLVEELARERELLRALMDNVPDHIYFKDRQGRFLRANVAVAQFFGLTDPGQIVGRTVFEFFGKEAAQESHDDEQDVMATGKPILAKEVKQIWPGRQATWVSTTKMPLRDAGGIIIGTFGVSHDITERKRAEEAIRASEERYRELFENASDLVFTTDLKGGLTSLNRVGERTMGYAREEATQMNLVQLVDRKHWAIIEKTLERLLAGESSLTLELEIMAKDGRRVMLEVKPRLIYKDGKPVAIQGIGRDITGREAAEIELRQAQKLESVGRLASGIAHEINTPIQFVGDNTRFLQDSFGGLQTLHGKYQELREAAASNAVSPGLLNEVRRAEEESDCAYLLEEIPKALSQTLDGVTRVATIVRAMKDFAHPEGKEKAAADLNKALQSTLTVARNELKYVADVETELGDLPLVVCNIGDLNQVFLNLLVNAAHAISDVKKDSGEKGTIRVRTAAEGKTVLVAISDNGCGIPEGIRSRIFDPFFTTKEVGRGTGQGLAIGRSVVVERHKGSLTFESEVGKGTTFFVRLPIEGGEDTEGG